MSTTSEPVRPALRGLRVALAASITLAVVLLGVWLWSRYCRFPSIPWNDMRLAPSVALAQGWPVYPTADSGTIGTWMYGPLPILFYWPASWASTAAGALLTAGALNLVLTLIPLAVVCLLWPVDTEGRSSGIARIAAIVLCLSLWPELHYSVIFSDNLAVALGLIGNLVLIRARTEPALWIAALLATATVACKQISLGIPLAQVLWLGVVGGRQAAWRHVARCVGTGAAVGAFAVGLFGWRGLWYTLVTIPGGLTWAPDIGQRFRQVAPELALLVGVPAVVMVLSRARFREFSLLLSALAWVCTLPLGVAGLLKVGGWTNSIHSFVLWAPAVATTLLAKPRSEFRARAVQLAAVLLAAVVVCGRIVREPYFPLRPATADYATAAAIAAKHREAVWFPVHPLVTLYSDHRYYHDEDGMYVRIKARQPISAAQAAAHLPRAMQATVTRNDWSDWGISRRMLGPQVREEAIGNWTLRRGVAAGGGP